jgi:ferric iron reductase protein FhuF
VTAFPPARPSGERALEAAAELGPFFGADAQPGPDWSSWAALIADPALLARRAVEVRAVLAAGPGSPDVAPAVVASLVHLGLVGRLVAPPLGAALLSGVLPVAPVEQVHVRLAGANPLPLALGATSAAPLAGPADLAAAFVRCWLTPAVEPLTVAVRGSWAVSRKVLDGNVTSAVAGALRMAATARPGLAGRAEAVLDALLASGPLAGTGRRREDGSFVRRSCCLFYRLPGAGTCGDCVLDDQS